MSDLKTEAIIRRIRALMEKTEARGCTEAEALAAAAMVGKMMDEYNLSLTDIQISSSEMLQSQINTGAKSKNQPQILCCNAIAFFTDTKVWSGSKGGNVTIEWFGMKPDVMMAEYLYAIIDRSLTYEYLRWSRENDGNRFLFWEGMAARINERLRAMKKERNTVNESTGRSLVIVKGALVTAEFAKLNLFLKGAKPRQKPRYMNDREFGAYQAGKSAGDRVSLGSGVGMESREKLN